MIILVYREKGEIKKTSDPSEIQKIPQEQYLWFDTKNISKQEIEKYRDDFGVDLTIPKQKKIRHRFKFFEKEGVITITTHMMLNQEGKVSTRKLKFIVRDDFVISNHNISEFEYDQLYDEILTHDSEKVNGALIFLLIFERILESDINVIEDKTKKILRLSNEISKNYRLQEELVYEMTDLQEELIGIRRNIIEKQRILSSVEKSELFSGKKLNRHIGIIDKDINSILDYLSFDFERLEYLQDTLMGLINLRQNTIMKIFTIVSVIFLPPTLIASIYGMNFPNMPELHFKHAYPIALLVMVGLSLLTLYLFKRKKWL